MRGLLFTAAALGLLSFAYNIPTDWNYAIAAIVLTGIFGSLVVAGIKWVRNA